jgi:hypothetical protein
MLAALIYMMRRQQEREKTQDDRMHELVTGHLDESTRVKGELVGAIKGLTQVVDQCNIRSGN